MNARFATKGLLAAAAFALCLSIATGAQAAMLFADSVEDFPAVGTVGSTQGVNNWQYGYIPNFSPATYNGTQFVPFVDNGQPGAEWNGSQWVKASPWMEITKDKMLAAYVAGSPGSVYAVARRWTATDLLIPQSVVIHQEYSNNLSGDGVTAWIYNNGAQVGFVGVVNGFVTSDKYLAMTPTDQLDVIVDVGLMAYFGVPNTVGDMTNVLVQIAPIPEPSSVALLGLGGLALGLGIIRRRSAR